MFYIRKMNLVLRETMIDKKILIAAFVSLSLVIVGLVFLLSKCNCIILPLPRSAAMIYENPRLINVTNKNIEVISKNPDLIFENLPENYIKSVLNFKIVNMGETAKTFYPWAGNAAYFLDGYPPGLNKEGVVSVHPQNVVTPTYIYQEVNLSDGDYIVAATIANIGNYTSNPCGDCNDNIFVIRVTDLATGLEEKIYEDEINSHDDWKTVYLNISDYGNKTIRFVLEGHAGGSCGDWCAEFGAIDNFYVGRIS